MDFKSVEVIVNDDKGRFFCSLIFITNNKNKLELEDEEFQKRVNFTTKFFTNVFLFYSFRDLTIENNLNKVINDLHNNDIFYCSTKDNDCTLYDVINLEKIFNKIQNQELSEKIEHNINQIISNMCNFLDNSEGIIEYYKKQKYQQYESQTNNCHLNLTQEWLEYLLPDHIECIFGFDCCGRMIPNYYIKDINKIPNIKESLSAVSLSKIESEKVIRGRTQAECMASFCLTMTNIKDPEVLKYFRYYIGKEKEKDLIDINNLLDNNINNNIPFLVFFPPSHPNHAFLGLLDIQGSKEVLQAIQEKFSNNNIKFKQKITDMEGSQARILSKDSLKKQNQDYITEFRKSLIPKNYEEKIDIAYNDEGSGEKIEKYYLTPSNLFYKKISQIDLADIMFYSAFVKQLQLTKESLNNINFRKKFAEELYKSISMLSLMFCPIIARLDSSGAGNVYRFSMYNINSPMNFLETISQKYRLISIKSFSPPEFHAWPQGLDNFQGDYAGTCSYFIDADIYSFGLVLQDIICNKKITLSFKDAINIKSDPKYQLFVFKNMLDIVSPKQDLLKIVDREEVKLNYKNSEVIQITKSRFLLINTKRLPLTQNDRINDVQFEQMTIDGSIPIHLTFNIYSFLGIIQKTKKSDLSSDLFYNVDLEVNNRPESQRVQSASPKEDDYSYNTYTYEVNIRRCNHLINNLSKIRTDIEDKTSENKRLLIIEMLKLTIFINMQQCFITNDENNTPEEFLKYSEIIDLKVLENYFSCYISSGLFDLKPIYTFEKQLFNLISNEKDKILSIEEINNIFETVVPEAFRNITIETRDYYSHNTRASVVELEKENIQMVASTNKTNPNPPADLKSIKAHSSQPSVSAKPLSALNPPENKKFGYWQQKLLDERNNKKSINNKSKGLG